MVNLLIGEGNRGLAQPLPSVPQINPLLLLNRWWRLRLAYRIQIRLDRDLLVRLHVDIGYKGLVTHQIDRQGCFPGGTSMAFPGPPKSRTVPANLPSTSTAARSGVTSSDE